jgi:hypothetical protein
MEIEWRFISLRVINGDKDYATHFPPHYERGHTGGLRLLRVCAAAREGQGAAVVGDLYSAMGEATWEGDGDGLRDRQESVAYGDGILPVLAQVGLPETLAGARDDERWDEVIRTESEEALELTGRDVGTPIMEIDGGLAFFGPVISRVPAPDQALDLWDHVVGISKFPGFAELKRSMRERIQFDTGAEEPGEMEEWEAGRLRS